MTNIEDAPYLEHGHRMKRLSKLPYFCPIHYLAVQLLEERGNLTPGPQEIAAIDAKIRIALSMKEEDNPTHWGHEDMMGFLEEETCFCPINYLAVHLLESGNIDFDWAEIEPMEERIRATLASIKE